jgi:hypothetical protein
MIDEYGERRWSDIDRENRRTRRKTCPCASLSTTNPTWIVLGANPGIRDEKPATNLLSHGTALCDCYPSRDAAHGARVAEGEAAASPSSRKKILFVVSSSPCLSPANGSFPLVHPTKILCLSVVQPMNAARSTQLLLRVLVTLTTLVKSKSINIHVLSAPNRLDCKWVKVVRSE